MKTHIHIHGLRYAGFKTGRAKCGRPVTSAMLAVEEDATCEVCRDIVDREHALAMEMVETYKRVGMDPAKLIEDLNRGPSYRNVEAL